MTITEELKREREATAELVSEIRQVSIWLTINGASTGQWASDLATRATAALDKHQKQLGGTHWAKLATAKANQKTSCKR